MRISADELIVDNFAGGGGASLVRDVPNVIFAPRTRHSAKPDELLEIAERLSPGPRLEMFARRARPGWVAWGNQAPTGDEL
jgi:N6-adenosine-specific RNA methylase IME4